MEESRTRLWQKLTAGNRLMVQHKTAQIASYASLKSEEDEI